MLAASGPDPRWLRRRDSVVQAAQWRLDNARSLLWWRLRAQLTEADERVAALPHPDGSTARPSSAASLATNSTTGPRPPS